MSQTRNETQEGSASQNLSEIHDQRADNQKPLRLRKIPYIHALQRTLYDLQKVRIASGNRMESLANTCLKCGKRWKREQKKRCECFEPMITADQHTSLNAMIGKAADSMEMTIEKPIRKALKGVPICEWMKGRKGLGPRLIASIHAALDPISSFDTISKVWAYGGVDVVNGRGTNKNAMNDRKFNWELHMLICEKVPTQFIKQGGFYRDLYDKIKADYQRKYPEPVDSGRRTKSTKSEPDGHPIMNYTPIHIERMTRRKLGKIFIAHVWMKWREFEGLPFRGPWVLEHGGHNTMIDPPEEAE